MTSVIFIDLNGSNMKHSQTFRSLHLSFLPHCSQSGPLQPDGAAAGCPAGQPRSQQRFPRADPAGPQHGRAAREASRPDQLPEGPQPQAEPEDHADERPGPDGDVPGLGALGLV